MKKLIKPSSSLSGILVISIVAILLLFFGLCWAGYRFGDCKKVIIEYQDPYGDTIQDTVFQNPNAKNEQYFMVFEKYNKQTYINNNVYSGDVDQKFKWYLVPVSDTTKYQGFALAPVQITVLENSIGTLYDSDIDFH